MVIVKATEKDMGAIRELFREYQKSLDIDVCFQNFEQELAALPGDYAPPNGAIFLVADNNNVKGCIGIRPNSANNLKDANEAELKRLYVRPEYRGQGIGKELFIAAMSEAREIGYSAVVLDTLQTMEVAQSIYANYGFKEIPTYYKNPENGLKYFRCLLIEKPSQTE